MRSRWLLLLAFGLASGLSLTACGPQKKYCVSTHTVCSTEVKFDASEPEVEEPTDDGGPVILP